MLDFCLQNWKLIISGILVIISVIVFILRKKPVNDIESFIFKASIDAVKAVENSGKKGKDKLETAILFVSSVLQAQFPDLDAAKYFNYISKVIEAILSTPQKK